MKDATGDATKDRSVNDQTVYQINEASCDLSTDSVVQSNSDYLDDYSLINGSEAARTCGMPK